MESANPRRTTKLKHFQWDTSVFVPESPLVVATFLGGPQYRNDITKKEARKGYLSSGKGK